MRLALYGLLVLNVLLILLFGSMSNPVCVAAFGIPCHPESSR